MTADVLHRRDAAVTEAGITGIDHVAVMTRDLDGVARAWHAMGFALTPFSRHSGARVAGGPVEPWGIGNRCAMLRQGYLELMGIHDETLYIGDAGMRVDRYEGVHILAFACDDADAMAGALAARGFEVAGVHGLERDLETPEGIARARFKLVRAGDGEMPEGRVFAIEHATPELLWQPHLLDHPNRVTALAEVLVCVDDPFEAASRYRRFLRHAPQRAGPALVFAMKKNRLVLTDPAGLAALLPGAVAPVTPYVAAVTLASADLAQTAAVLDQGGVAFARHEGRLVVAAEAARGTAIVFSDSP
jgi:Glyoxalase-like domain